MGLTLPLTIRRASHTFLFQSGTDDFRTLSAIYSQLGNAYFYLGDYVKAMQVLPHLLRITRFQRNVLKDYSNVKLAFNLPWQYHKHDLTLARTMGDRLGEAKASGNLGNTLKVVKYFQSTHFQSTEYLFVCFRLWGSLRRPLFAVGDI